MCVADEVPGSAVLVFDIELIDMEEGLPEGYMFIWNDDVSPDLFAEMDKDDNKQVEPSEVRDNLLTTSHTSETFSLFAFAFFFFFFFSIQPLPSLLRFCSSPTTSCGR